jgi:glycosyltransferase involved in cell wall biosynthesis
MDKVYFIGSAYMGCWYVRCFQPMLENGWGGSYTGLSKSTLKDPKLVAAEALGADIIVFHRANTIEHHKMAMQLKAQGKKIVFDNDDTFLLDNTHAFMGVDEAGYEQNKERVNNIINNFVKNCDLVTTTTKVLADEYRKINPNVHVIPNCINPDDWATPLKNDGDKVRIGLVGSVMYHQDFEVIKPLLKKLDKSDKVQLVLFGLWTDKKRSENPLIEKVLRREYKFWDSLKNKEQAQWCEVNAYMDTLNQLRLDMMLIPRRANYFNKCKSNIKFLEASMLEIPVIASNFHNSPYAELTDDIGVLVEDPKDWEEAVMNMVNNKSRREIIGLNARQYVLDNYDIKNNAHKWADVYKTI